MADKNKDFIESIKPQNKGKFRLKAKAHGESTKEYADEVVKSKSASPKLKREAQFAKNVIGIKKK